METLKRLQKYWKDEDTDVKRTASSQSKNAQPQGFKNTQTSKHKSSPFANNTKASGKNKWGGEDKFDAGTVIGFGLLGLGGGVLGLSIGSIFNPLTAGVGCVVGSGLGLAAAASLKDQNGDGRIDIEDILIGAREILQWIFSWRGAMVVFGFSLVGSAYLNILSWITAVSSLGPLAPVGGFSLWAAIQAFELLPIMDDLNIKASLAAMVRRQRKPLEVPALNETLNPDARRMQRRYAKREANQRMIGEFVRYAFYALELCVLVLAGNIVNFLGVEWGNILLAIVGMVGVELSLRMFNYAGEQLMTPEERAQMRTLMASTKRTTMSLE